MKINVKKIIFVLLIFNMFSLYSQNNEYKDDFYEDILHATKVIINKKVASYNTAIGEGSPKFSVDLKSPYYLYIKSDETGAQIRINSSKFREDIILPFKAIYKVNNSESIEYAFVGTPQCDATYHIPKNGDHQMFLITIKEKNGDDIKLSFIISKFEQL